MNTNKKKGFWCKTSIISEGEWKKNDIIPVGCSFSTPISM